MRKSIGRWLCLLLLICTLLPAGKVSAITPVDTERKGSITLYYTQDGTGFGNLEIKIYRVATAAADGTFDLISPFSSYPVNIHGITSQKEWKDTAATLVAYIASNQVKPDHTAKTDAAGTVTFEELQTGLYLILGTRAENDNGIYLFDDFLLYLPTLLEDGSVDYDLEAKPKCSNYTPKKEYKVIKLWKDTGYTKKRPTSITIDILKDGVVQETQVLNAANNWTYSWRVPDGDGVWTVVEKNVPKGYKVTISANTTTFTVTNTYKDPNTDIPKTGDTFLLWPYILTMCLSGFLLLILDGWRRRRS